MRRKGWLYSLVFAGMLLLGGCMNLPPPKTAEQEAQELKEAREEAARQAQRPVNICSPDARAAFGYRKKILVLSMPVVLEREAADMSELSKEWSRSLQNRLRASERLLVIDGSDIVLDPQQDISAQILTLARRHDAQYVISGNLGSLQADLKSIHIGPFLPVRWRSEDMRRVESQITVYDGFNGTQMARLLYQHKVEGPGVINERETRLKGEFFTTPIGRVIDRQLQRQSEDIVDEVACMPLVARVLQTEQGGALIDVGGLSLLHPGDRLKLYQRRYQAMAGGVNDHWVEEDVGSALVQQVFPQTARVTLETAFSPALLSEAVVRAW